MKAAAGSVNERLDRENATRVCQESELVERLDGQLQGHRKGGKRWNGTGGLPWH
jgi:hypothetical protein